MSVLHPRALYVSVIHSCTRLPLCMFMLRLVRACVCAAVCVRSIDMVCARDAHKCVASLLYASVRSLTLLLLSLRCSLCHALLGMRVCAVRVCKHSDWYVNRCGKEVRYIIDYYSNEVPDPHGEGTGIEYFVDARPAPTAAGLVDRARVAWSKWRRGEKWF